MLSVTSSEERVVLESLEDACRALKEQKDNMQSQRDRLTDRLGVATSKRDENDAANGELFSRDLTALTAGDMRLKMSNESLTSGALESQTFVGGASRTDAVSSSDEDALTSLASDIRRLCFEGHSVDVMDLPSFTKNDDSQGVLRKQLEGLKQNVLKHQDALATEVHQLKSALAVAQSRVVSVALVTALFRRQRLASSIQTLLKKLAEFDGASSVELQLDTKLHASRQLATEHEDQGPEVESAQQLTASTLPQPYTVELSQGFQLIPSHCMHLKPAVGRDCELQSIERYLKNGDDMRVQVVNGCEGIGKRHVVFEYAHRHMSDYPDGILYFDMENEVALQRSISDVLLSLSVKQTDDLPNYLLEQCENKSKCLLIYDHVTDLNVAVQHIHSSFSFLIHVLVTTCLDVPDDFLLSSYNVLNLQPLDVSMSVEFLLASGSCHQTDTREAILCYESFKQQIPTGCRYAELSVGSTGLNGSPLSLQHAASFIRRYSKDVVDIFAEYWELLSNSKKSEEWKPQLDAVWLLDIQDIKKCSGLARQLLLCCSFLPSHSIPKAVLFAFATLLPEKPALPTFNSAINLLLSRSLLVVEDNSDNVFGMHGLVGASVLRSEPSHKELDRVLTVLCKAFLNMLPPITAVRQLQQLNNGSVLCYATHLYHVATQIIISSPPGHECREALELACILSIHLCHLPVGAMLCDGHLQYIKKSSDYMDSQQLLCQALSDIGYCAALVKHTDEVTGVLDEAVELAGTCQEYACNAESWAKVMVEIAEAYIEADQETKGEALLEKVVDRLKSSGLTKIGAFAHALALTSWCLIGKHKNQEAIEVATEACNPYDQSHSSPTCHCIYAMASQNLGIGYLNQNLFSEAQFWLNHAVDSLKVCLPPYHPRHGKGLMDLGTCYNNEQLGCFQMSRELLGDALGIAMVSADAKLASHVLERLCESHRCENTFKDGEKFGKCATEAMQTVYGATHKKTACAMVQLGCCIDGQGRHSEGEQIFRQAIDIMKRHLHQEKNDWRIAFALTSLGYCLAAQNKYGEAEEAFAAALDIHSRIHRIDHPLRKTLLIQVGACRLYQENWLGTEGSLQEAIDICIRTLDPNNQTTRYVWSLLGHCYLKQQRFQEAEYAFQQALKISWSNHPEGSQEIGTELMLLGDCFKAQSKLDQADTTYQKAVEVLWKTCGESHLHTLMAMKKLESASETGVQCRTS